MKRFTLSSLRTRAFILVIAAILPATALAVYSGIMHNRIAIKQAEERVLDLAKNLSSTQNLLIADARQLLYALSQLPQVQKQDGTGCSKIFGDILKASKAYTNILGVTLNGHVFASALPTEPSVNFADRFWFKDLLKTRDFVMGKYIIGRITGKSIMVLAHPVFDAGGQLKRIVSIGLNLEWLNESVKNVGLPPGGTLTVLDRNGTILLHYPDSKNWVGKQMNKSPMYLKALAEKEGVLEGIGLDGGNRIYGFTSSGGKGAGVFVLLGIPKSLALAPTSRATTRHIVILALVSAMVLLAAWLIGEMLIVLPANKLLVAAQELTNGDLSARSGIDAGKGEIIQIAKAFDLMAETLEKREFERKNNEAEKLKLVSLIEQSTDMIGIVSLERKVVYLNPSVVQILGSNKNEEGVGMPISEYLTDQSLEKLEKEILPGILEKNFWQGEFEFKNVKTGKLIPVEFNAFLIKGQKSGQPTEVAIVARDLSELKKSEQALTEEKDKFQLLADGSPLGISIISNDNFIYINPEFTEMFGYTLQDIPRRKDFVRQAFPDEEYRDWAISIRNKNHDKHESGIDKGAVRVFEVVCKDGTKKTIRFFPGNMATGDWLVIYQDTTREKRFGEQLLQSQKMEAIGTLASGIAHDFNNILYAIIGYAEMGLDKTEKNSKAAKYFREILNGGNRAESLTKNILAFCRQEEPVMKPILIQPIIEETIQLMRASMPSTIKISLQIDEECGPVMGDSAQIHQVLVNLFTNASHAIQDEFGHIAVDLTEINIQSDYYVFLVPGRYIRLSIGDDGCGIKSEDLKRIFDPYFTTKAPGQGSGLGLSIIQGIIKNHNGEITVYSEPEQGSTFNVYFPLLLKNSKETEKQIEISSQLIPAADENILLVDDDPSVVNMVKVLLEDIGYHVTAYTNSMEALNDFRSQPEKYDVVITDMTMPQMRGDQLSQKLLEIRPHIPIILCTGFSDQINKETAKTIGIREFIMKPVRKRKMAQLIRKVMND